MFHLCSQRYILPNYWELKRKDFFKSGKNIKEPTIFERQSHKNYNYPYQFFLISYIHPYQLHVIHSCSAWIQFSWSCLMMESDKDSDNSYICKVFAIKLRWFAQWSGCLDHWRLWKKHPKWEMRFLTISLLPWGHQPCGKGRLQPIRKTYVQWQELIDNPSWATVEWSPAAGAQRVQREEVWGQK